MPVEQGGDPWSTYKGFAGGAGAPTEPPQARPVRRPGRRRSLVIGGVAAALLAGLGFGFWARPQLGGAPPARPTAEPTPLEAAAAPPAQMPIALAPQPAAPPAPQAPGRLETLPPEMVAAARAAAAPRKTAPAVTSEADDADVAATGDTAVNAPPIQGATPSAPAARPEAGASAPAPEIRAGFDCASARPGAEQVVCADPALAAADRRMSRAYRRALRSGADPADLRQEQRDWMAIREDAARRSPRALAQVYDQRIQDLDRIADEAASGPAPDDGDAQ